MVVWGGDVRDRDPWSGKNTTCIVDTKILTPLFNSAAEKLQATTYPFVAFVALQPHRTPVSGSSSRSPNSPPTLTVLSRHQGPSILGGPTSAQTLCDHLENQLLPRVTPFLDRIHATQRERERDRLLREEQDRAFQDSARRDIERIQGKMEEERREQERQRIIAEEQGRQRQREEERKLKEERRMEWRRWMRRMDSPAGEGPSRGVRIAARLPSDVRVVRTFEGAQTLTALYAFVDAHLVPERYAREEDPTDPPEGVTGDGWEACLEAQIEREGDGAEWWGFQLALAYPRKEIPWAKGCALSGVESLRGGGQVVVEMKGNGGHDGNGSDDGYHTEESE